MKGYTEIKIKSTTSLNSTKSIFVNSNKEYFTKALTGRYHSIPEKLLDEKKSPSRRVNELDNRGSHFYLTLYWAEALAAQDKDAALKAEFSAIAKALSENEAGILEELVSVQGSRVGIDGYYLPNTIKTDKAMRPSATLNRIIGL